MVKLVKRMLDLHKRLPKAKGASKTAIERRIKATDRQIDEWSGSGKCHPMA